MTCASRCGRCPLCRLAWQDARYAALLGLPFGGGTAVPHAARPPRLTLAAPCRHGPGEPTGETVECRSCRGTVKLKLFACAKYGVCTSQKRVPGVACCEGCTGREAAPDIFPLPFGPRPAAS